MTRFDKLTRPFVYGLLLAALLLASCAPAATPVPTQTPLPTNTPAPKNTPQPTSTPTPVPTNPPPPTSTPTSTPTRTPTPDYAATQAYRSTQTQEAVLALVGEDLKTIDLSTDQGRLGYYDPEGYIIDNTEYSMIMYNPMDPGNRYKNFVLHTDISWESSSGLAGCGLILRAQDPIMDGKALLFGTWRLAGYPAWDLNYWNYGKHQSSLSGLFTPNNAIQQDNGSVNHYLLFLKDNIMTAYANGTKISTVPIDAVPDAGEFGIFTRQESGKTTCSFTNTWIWSLD